MTEYVFANRWALLATASMIACAMPIQAFAQDNASRENASANDDPAEIIVTAQKREERLSDIPLAISAVSGDDLALRGYKSIADFTGAIPGLSISNFAGQARTSIRGVNNSILSPGADPSVGYYLNGVYLPRPNDQAAAFFDVARIEVLRGPQGTLYGRNAIGGAINLINNRPTDSFYLSTDLSYGNYNTVETRLAISGPVSDNIRVRLATATDNHDGYSLNLFNGKRYDDRNTQSVRGTLEIEPTPTLRLTTTIDYNRQRDGSPATHFLGKTNTAVLPGVIAGGVSLPLNADGEVINPRLLSVDTLPRTSLDSGGIAQEIAWTGDGNLAAKSITSYRRYRSVFEGDNEPTTANFPSGVPNVNYTQFQRSRTFSQELQLLYSSPDLEWILGLYYSNDKMPEGGYNFGFTPAATQSTLRAAGSLNQEAYAAFGQASYKVTPDLKLTLGLRYGRENQSNDVTWTDRGVLLSGRPVCLALPGGICRQVASYHDTSLLPKFGISYNPAEDVMLFANVSKGYKSGGLSIQTLAPAFLPSTDWAYEAGIKAHGHRWSASLSGFYYDYKNYQISRFANGLASIVNAPKVRYVGGEFEGRYEPVDGLTLSYAFSYVDATFRDFQSTDTTYPALGLQDLRGRKVPNAVPYSSNLGVTYETPVGTGQLRLFGEWNLQGPQYFTEFNTGIAKMDSYSVFNAAIRYTGENDKWYAEISGKNLSDTLIYQWIYISSASLGSPRNSFLAPPRTYKFTVGFRY